MNKTKFMQTDSRWGGLGYPKKPWYIRNCGCGEVSIANIIIEMEQYANYTPATIQPYCKQFAAKNGDGTFWSGIPAMMKHYGLTEVKEHATMKSLWDELAKGGRVAVYLMGSRKGGSKKVHWTSGGHFVCSVDYKYEGGKHWVYVKDSYSNSSLRNGWISYEGNMKNDVIKVWSGKPNGSAPKPTPSGKLVVDGIGGIATVNRLQDFLGIQQTDGITIRKDLKQYVPSLTAYDYGKSSPTVLRMQKWLGLADPDGCWGPNTSRALQKKVGATADGIFGVNSMKALQRYLNEHPKAEYPSASPSTTTTASSNANKVIETAKALAGKSSSPESAYKKALNKAYPNRKKWGKGARLGRSCDVFVGTVLRSCGLDKSCPRGLEDQLTHVPDKKYFTRKTYKNIAPYGVTKPGDVIIYNGKNGHACIRTKTGIYEANHSSKKYPHFTKGFSRLKKKRPKVVVWRPI